MAVKVKVRLDLPSASEAARRIGIDPGGAVQRFHTQNVLRRIQRYMPYRTGALIKLTVAQTDISRPEIVTAAPGAVMLYHGKVMVDSVTGVAGFMTADGWKSRKGSTKVATARDITYTQEKNPHAGPYWDRALVANEGEVLVRELQNYIDHKGGKA